MNSKKIIIITGGAGFVGSNLISFFLDKTKFKIISIDDYSSGHKRNHIKNKRIKYLKSHTKFIDKIIPNPKLIYSIFHFGEFARIYQSFKNLNQCIESNTIGSNAVFNFCLKNRIKLIYSATSATLGNNGNDKNLSPYAFTKSKNLEFLENLKKWYNFKFEVVYLNKKPLPVVLPGTQSRRFTHIKDTVEICYKAWKNNLCRHYTISNKKSYSIIEVAKMFGSKIKFLPKRPGERYASALTKISLSNKVYKNFGKINLVDYINNFLEKN